MYDSAHSNNTRKCTLPFVNWGIVVLSDNILFFQIAEASEPGISTGISSSVSVST